MTGSTKRVVIPIKPGIIILSAGAIITNAFSLAYIINIQEIRFLPDLQDLILKFCISSILTYALLIFTTLVEKRISKNFLITIISILVIFKLVVFSTIFFHNYQNLLKFEYISFFYFSTIIDTIIGLSIEKELAKQ